MLLPESDCVPSIIFHGIVCAGVGVGVPPSPRESDVTCLCCLR